MTRAFVVALGLVAVLAGRAQAEGRVRDVRPTVLERGDTLIVECPGVTPGQPAEVIVTPPSGPALRLSGQGSRGDRVLVAFDEALAEGLGPRRIEEARIEVLQGIGPDVRHWRSPPGAGFTLTLSPSTLRAAAHRAGAAAAGVGLPAPLVTAGIVLLVALVIHLLVAPITGLVVVWERKISGRMQSRLGPNRVGPRGWLQWLADAIKMITKEDLVPTEADATLFKLSPYLMWMSVFATFVVLPLSQAAIVADMNVGLLYLTSVTSLTVIAILIGGWASNSKWSLLGGMRSAAQIVSYELPASLALLQIAVLAGTLSPQEIVRAQGGLPHQWFVFSNPLTFGCFFIYFISALAEGNRAPFDLPEAESELVSGYNTEYSGFRFGIFSLAEWSNIYVMAAIVTTMFLGGWNIPFVSPDTIAGSTGLEVLSALVAVTKIVALVFVIIWVRWTLPRFRIDQLMTLCWKYLIPLSFAAFLGTTIWVWVTHLVPVLGTVVSWATFLLGGVGLGLLFGVRVVANFRATKLLYLPDDAQFTWPFIERHIDKR